MTDMVEGIPNYVEATPSTSNSTEKQNTETEESSSTASNSKHFEDEEHEETNLFVGDLSRDIDEEQLLAAFANFGEVKQRNTFSIILVIPSLSSAFFLLFIGR